MGGHFQGKLAIVFTACHGKAPPLRGGEMNYLLLKRVILLLDSQEGGLASNIKPGTAQQVYSSQEFSCTRLNNNPCRQSGPKGPVSTRLYQAGELQTSQKFSQYKNTL